jgi:hypothetical protein
MGDWLRTISYGNSWLPIDSNVEIPTLAEPSHDQPFCKPIGRIRKPSGMAVCYRTMSRTRRVIVEQNPVVFVQHEGRSLLNLS